MSIYRHTYQIPSIFLLKHFYIEDTQWILLPLIFVALFRCKLKLKHINFYNLIKEFELVLNFLQGYDKVITIYHQCAPLYIYDFTILFQQFCVDLIYFFIDNLFYWNMIVLLDQILKFGQIPLFIFDFLNILSVNAVVIWFVAI